MITVTEHTHGTFLVTLDQTQADRLWAIVAADTPVDPDSPACANLLADTLTTWLAEPTHT